MVGHIKQIGSRTGNAASSQQAARQRKLRLAAALALVPFSGLTGHAAQAATLAWDPTQVPGTPAGGTGTWDLATANWSNGAADSIWVNSATANTAQFAGSAGNVTLNTSLSGLGLQFTTTGYTISGNGTLTLGAGGINASTLTTGTTTVTNAVSLTGGESWTLGSGATLAASGTVTRNVGSTVDFSTTGTFNGAGLLSAVGTTVGGWATIGGTNWAVSNGTNIAAIGSYTNDTWASGGNTTVTLASNTAYNNVTTNSLRFNTAAADTVTLSGTDIITSGGILVTSNVGNNLSMITGGTLEGSSGGDLVIIQNNTSNGLTIASAIANNTSATGLTKSGAGLLTLSSTGSNFSGSINVNAGTLSLTGAWSTAYTGNINIASGATLSSTAENTLGNPPTGTWTIAGTLSTASTGNTGFVLPANVTLNNGTITSIAGNTNSFGATYIGVSGSVITASGASNTISSTDIGLGFGVTFNTPNSTDALAISSILGSSSAKSQSVTKTGNGTVTLSGADIYTGTTALSAGTLAISGNGTLGSGAALTLAGGTLDLGTTSQTVGAVSITTAAASGNTIQNGNLTGTSYAASNTSGNAIVSANLLVDGGAGLTKSGAGTLTLSGADTYSGSTVLNGGTLILAANANNTAGGVTSALSNSSSSLALANGSTLELLGNTTNTIFEPAANSGAGNLTAGVIESGNGTFNFYVANNGTGTGNTLILANFGQFGTTGGNVAPVFNLSGANGYTLQMGSGSSGNGTLDVYNNTTINSNTAGVTLAIPGGITINFGAAYTLTFGGPGNITSGALVQNGGNASALTVTGPGTLTLTSASNFTGATTINGGTLAISGSGTLGNGGNLILAGGTVDLGTTSQTVGAVSVTTAAASGNTIQNGNLTGTSYAASNTTGTAIITANLLGSGVALTKSGVGTLTLAGSDSYSGSTALNAGTLQFNGPSAMSSNSALTLASGTTLSLANGNSTTFATSGNISVPNASTVTFNVGPLASGTNQTLTLSGGLNFTANNSVNQINVTGSGNYTLGLGAVAVTSSSSGGPYNFTINATTAPVTLASFTGTNFSSNLILEGGSTITLGPTNVTSNGSLAISFSGPGTTTVLSGAATKAGSGSNTVTLSSGNTLDIGNAAALLDTFTISGGTMDNTSGNASLTLSNNPPQTWNGNFTFNGTNSLNLGTGAITLGGNETVTVNANTLTAGGAIGGSGLGITKAGAGTLTLSSNTSSFTGNITVNGGTLQMNGANSTAASVTVNSGGILALNVADALGFTNAKNVPTINSGGTITNITSASRVTLWNGLTMTGGTLTGTGSGDASGAYSLSGTIVARSDAGGNAATISGSPISLQNQNVANGNITFNVTRGSATPASDLTISARVIPITGTANIGIIKAGNGTMALSASNTYSGSTTISAGTIRANNLTGSATGAGAVTVAAASSNYGGGRLGGNGTVGGTVTLGVANATARQGGIITAGADDSTAGKLTTGAEAWSGGAVYKWKITNAGTGVTGGPTKTSAQAGGNSTTWDDLAIGGALTVGSSGSPISVANGNAFTIQLSSLTGNQTTPTPTTGFDATKSYSWIIGTVSSISLNGAATLPVTTNTDTKLITGATSDLFALDTSGFNLGTAGNALPSGAPGFELDAIGIGSGDNIVVSYEAAPEPGTTVLVLAGAVPMLAARRRRRKSLDNAGNA